jgi:VCBS repeat-containing protein
VTSTATLYITVLGASSGAPSAVNDGNSINEGDTSVSKTAGTGVLSNDTKDSTGSTVIRVSSGQSADTVVDGSGDYEVTGLYGTLKIKADGSYTYTLDANNAAVNALHGGESLAETFQYVLNDASGGSYVGVDAATPLGASCPTARRTRRMTPWTTVTKSPRRKTPRFRGRSRLSMQTMPA